MLVGTVPCRHGLRHVRRAHRLDRAPQGGDDVHQTGHTGSLIDHEVKALVEFQQGPIAAARASVFELFQQLPDGPHVLGRCSLRGNGRGQWLELATDEEDLPYFVRCELSNDRPAVWDYLDEALRLELPERFTERSPAHLQALRLHVLEESSARRDEPSKNLTPQLICDLLRDRLGHGPWISYTSSKRGGQLDLPHAFACPVGRLLEGLALRAILDVQHGLGRGRPRLRCQAFRPADDRADPPQVPPGRDVLLSGAMAELPTGTVTFLFTDI